MLGGPPTSCDQARTLRMAKRTSVRIHCMDFRSFLWLCLRVGCVWGYLWGQGKDWQSLMMSIRNAFSAGAESDQHGVITTFPAILGESLQHSMTGTRIPLNHPSCKSVPVIICPSHLPYGMEKCIFNIYMAILTLKRSKWSCHWGILAQWPGHKARAQACNYFPAVQHVPFFWLHLPIPMGLQHLPQT